MRLTQIPVRSFALALACVASMGLMQQAQTQPVAAALKVSGVGMETKQLDAAALKALPRTTIKVREKDDVEATYEGVRVSDLLVNSGLTFGQNMRGPRLSDYLLAESADAYRVLFALPEFDPEFSDRVVIVADLRDGRPLTGRDGPLKVIVSDEKRHARWVRNVTSLTVQSAAKTPASAD